MSYFFTFIFLNFLFQISIIKYFLLSPSESKWPFVLKRRLLPVSVCFFWIFKFFYVSVSPLLSLGLDLIFIWFKVWLSGLLGFELHYNIMLINLNSALPICLNGYSFFFFLVELLHASWISYEKIYWLIDITWNWFT